MPSSHQPVLLQELIEALTIHPDDTVVDATLGGAGHARATLGKLSEKGTLVGIDRDKGAAKRAADVFSDAQATVHIVCDSFRNIDDVLRRLGIPTADAIYADLGLSSDQLEHSGRGFSFLRDEPLWMTFSDAPEGEVLTARDIVNEWDEEHIADILHGFGEERFSRRIARAIVEARREHPIEKTGKLVEVVESAVPKWYRMRKLHPATRTFQALRVAVNDELGALRDLLEKSTRVLVPNGRLAIISYHSAEDRMVKHSFQERVRKGEGMLGHKKPITPSAEEIAQNPRARSAKLRTLQKM